MDNRKALCSDYNKMIGLKLRQARKEANIKQKGAAFILHSNLNHIVLMEQGRRHIRACDVYLLSSLYKKDIQYFFEITENTTTSP